MNFKTMLSSLRLIGFAEGVSFLLLFGTMFLKYKMGIEGPNKVVGISHGILFIGFIFLTFWSTKEYKWSFKTFFLIAISSLIPFGTFLADIKIMKPKQLLLNQSIN